MSREGRLISNGRWGRPVSDSHICPPRWGLAGSGRGDGACARYMRETCEMLGSDGGDIGHSQCASGRRDAIARVHRD